MVNYKKKDGFGYGNLEATNTYDNAIVNDDETYVGVPIDKPIDEHETYIGKETKQQTDMNSFYVEENKMFLAKMFSSLRH